MKEIGTLVFLGWNAWLDIKKKEVSLATAALFAVAGILWSVQSKRSLIETAVTLGICCMFLALSLVTGGAVGMGDGWILLALGLMLEMDEFLYTICGGMILAGFWAAVLLAVFRKGRNTEIPFVPFLLAGYVGGLVLW